MRRQLFITVSLMTITLVASARSLSPQEALERAEQSLVTGENFHVMSEQQPSRLVHTMKDDGSPTVYIFDRSQDRGYLVVSADDCSGAALLGYCDNGNFPSDDIPENISWWLDQYSREIASASRRQKSTDDNEFTVPYVDPIAPICQTKWTQTSPFNEYCPVIDGVKCPTGCVATAMAQAMKVYNWPEKGRGSHTYRPASATEFLTVNFADSTYQWDKMLNSYSASSDKESCDAVASLMYCCGVAVSMQYHPHSAGGNYTQAARALVNYFDYDKSLRIIGREYYGIAEWFDMIIAELQAGHPVLISGKNEEAGHAFICDGYKADGYFHINWGWAGASDGYFLLTALNPEEQGIGGSAGGYNLDQQMVIGLKRPEEGSMIVPVMQFTSNFTSAQSGYLRTAGSVKVGDRRGIFNESIGNMHATMGVKLTDESGNVSYIESTTPDKMYVPGQGFMYYYLPTADFPQSGVYKVEPAVKDSVGRWFDCEVKLANDRELILTATADSLTFQSETLPSAIATDIELLSPIFPGKECCIKATLTNNTDMEFYEEVMPVLVQDHTDMADGPSIAVELLPGESRAFEWVGEFPSTLTPGEYLLYLVDSNNKDLNSIGLTVTVEEAPTAEMQVTVTSTDMADKVSTEQDPCEISYSDFRARVHIKCDAGYFSGMVYGSVWPLNSTLGIYEMDGGYLSVREGEEKVVDFSHDMSSYLHENTVYYFYARTTPTGRVGNKLYFTYSSVSGIDVVGEDNNRLEVRHVAGSDMVELKAPDEIVGVELYDVNGERVMAMECKSAKEQTLSITGISHGIYLLSVRLAAEATPQVIKIGI